MTSHKRTQEMTSTLAEGFALARRHEKHTEEDVDSQDTREHDQGQLQFALRRHLQHVDQHGGQGQHHHVADQGEGRIGHIHIPPCDALVIVDLRLPGVGPETRDGQTMEQQEKELGEKRGQQEPCGELDGQGDLGVTRGQTLVEGQTG